MCFSQNHRTVEQVGTDLWSLLTFQGHQGHVRRDFQNVQEWRFLDSDKFSAELYHNGIKKVGFLFLFCFVTLKNNLFLFQSVALPPSFIWDATESLIPYLSSSPLFIRYLYTSPFYIRKSALNSELRCDSPVLSRGEGSISFRAFQEVAGFLFFSVTLLAHGQFVTQKDPHFF